MLKQGVVAVALTLASSHIVLAQENSQAIQKVIVTGSNIKQIDAESATPLQIIKREEITRLGVSSVRQLLDTLTAATSSLSDIGGSNSFASGASSVDLRGLGKQSTLVLLNSRRVAPYALADYNEVFTNLDSLPIDAVERVDILRSGGSAVYGSDAVAGVINIITRGDYQGLHLRASHDRSLKNGILNTSVASLTGGFGNLSTDKYNILANVEVYKRSNANWRELVDDINPAYGNKFPSLADGSGQNFGNRGTPSTYSYPGNINLKPLGNCPTVNSGGSCVYDRYERFEARPSADRVNMLLAGKVDLGNDLESFSEVLYSRTETEYMSAFQSYGSSTAPSTWGVPRTGEQKTFRYHMLPATHPLNTSGAPADLRYRFVDSDGMAKAKSDQYRVVTGLRGVVGKYDWESAVGIMGGKTTNYERGNFSASGFKKVIGDYDKVKLNDKGKYVLDDPLFFNRDYKLGQPNSAEVLNTLFPQYGTVGKVTQYFVDGKISGEVASFNGRPITMAVGGDVRHEKFSINVTDNILSGDIVGRGAATANASRYTSALFTEANVPLLKGLDLIGAARIDKMQGFDAHVSPKLAVRWEASKELLVRATWEGGFRAPNLTESAESTKFSFTTSADPKRCPQARVMANDLRAQAAKLPNSDPNKAALLAKADTTTGEECPAGLANIVRNNPDLKPEVSRSSTIGFVLEPVKGTTLTMDYWHIQRKDEIENKSAVELLASEDTLPAGTVNRLPLNEDTTFSAEERAKYGVKVGPLVSTTGKFENVSKTKTHGVDVGLASRFNTGIGRLDLSGNATYMLGMRRYAATRNGGSWGDNLKGRYGNSALVANLGATLKTGDFTNSLRVVHESATKLQLDYNDSAYNPKACEELEWSESECRIASYNRFDYFVSYTGIKDLTLSLFVRNLLDKRPPQNLRALNGTGSGIIPQSLEDVTGRSVRVSLEYKFK